MSERPFARVDADDLVSCVACGLCLPHCPTFRTTGIDAHSPRGRIALITAVREGTLELDAGVTEALDTCVQCMGCLPACPSGVRYDRIIGPAVEELVSRRPTKRLRRTMTLLPLGRPRLLGLLTRLAALGQRLRLVPRRLSLPQLPILRQRRRPVGGLDASDTVVVFTGCVMDAWYSDVHRATHDVLTAMGFSVTFSDSSLCCGALHSHAGLSRRAHKLEGSTKESLAGKTIVVNSAGCGAHLQGVFDAEGKTDVVDVMAFIERNIDRLLNVCPPSPEAVRERVVVHDACHLRNIQKTHLATHRVLANHYVPVAIPDEGLCCGAGGAFALEHPAEARDIVARKFHAIESVLEQSTRFISSGNPGCLGHLTANKPSHLTANKPSHLTGVELVHPVQLVARMLRTGK